MSVVAVDMFSGAGGLSYGLMDAGIDVVAAFDNWDVAVATYKRNIGDHAHVRDLSDTESVIKEISAYDADLIAGGPPCQDFSTAGKRQEGDRANLTIAFARVVSTCRPRFFLMENVPQTRNSVSYNTCKTKLMEAGYHIAETVLNAALCGVPQLRSRLFVIGSLVDGLEADCAEAIEASLSDSPMSVKDYMKNEIDIEHYYRHPRNYSRRSVFSVHEPSPTIRGVNRPVPPNYRGNHLDSVKPKSVRPLTTYERSRIQTFPSDWDWGTSDRNTHAEIQVGNAVPVDMAGLVAKAIRNVAEA